MSESEGLESLSMSLMWPSILQAMESSVEIICERLEDVMKLPEIVNFDIFPSSKYECRPFIFKQRTRREDTLNLTESNSLNTIFHEWHLVSFRVPIVYLFHCILLISSTMKGATGQAEVMRSMDHSQASWGSAKGVFCPWVLSSDRSNLDG